MNGREVVKSSGTATGPLEGAEWLREIEEGALEGRGMQGRGS